VDILFSKQNAQPTGLTVVGLMTTAVAPSIEQRQSFFGVRFRPAMASAFIPEVAVLTDEVEPLESFWGPKAQVLSIENPASISTNIAFMKFLRERLSHAGRKDARM
jgi:hypothetical protein